jgi:hypothetical protein
MLRIQQEAIHDDSASRSLPFAADCRARRVNQAFCRVLFSQAHAKCAPAGNFIEEKVGSLRAECYL